MGSSWVVVALVLGAGCSGRSGGASRDSGSDVTPGDVGGSSSDAPPSPFDAPPSLFDAPPLPIDASSSSIDAPSGFDPCSPTAPLPPANELRTIQHGGQTRTYHVHVSNPGTRLPPKPIVLNFHGWGGTATQQAQMTGMDLAADDNGFIAIHPNGTNAMQAWNAGACCPPNAAVTADDVGFTAAILDDVSARICVNRRKVYATGFSNGAFMAYRLACELANRITAIAPVAGVLGVPTCNPVRAVPVGHFHGMLDTYVPFGEMMEVASVLGVTFRTVPATLDIFRVRNGCSGAPTIFFTSGTTDCFQFANGCTSGADVRLCRSPNASHSWPGVPPIPGETATQDINATAAMWLFFNTYELPP